VRVIELYMEGGGGTVDSRRLLRVGMEQFLGKLRTAAREKGLELRVVCCGGRREAHSRYAAARAKAECSVLMLVDSENAVEEDSREHLARQDNWADLASVPVEEIHMMVQVMETWLIADQSALQRYYGHGLRDKEIPGDEDLEGVPKADILSALHRATMHTQKGGYRKISHARRLLELTHAGTVRARCGHCELLFKALASTIEATLRTP